MKPEKKVRSHWQRAQYKARAGYGISRVVVVALPFVSRRLREVLFAQGARSHASLSSEILPSVAENGQKKRKTEQVFGFWQ